MIAAIITAYLTFAILALAACKLGWDSEWLRYGQPVPVADRHREAAVRMVASAARCQQVLYESQHS